MDTNVDRFWGVEPGRGLCLVGYDAAGLETAGLCHYLNNPEATEALLRDKPNDIHTSNARRLTEALGRPVDREWGAKTSWYAWLYGAYPTKLGSIVKGTPEDGDIVIDTFFRNVPGLKRLIDDIQYEWKSSSGRLVTIDHGYVNCPSVSASLNYKIQSLGAILMKLAAIILDQEGKKARIKFHLVGSIHDEGQIECEKDRAEELGKLAVWSIEEAGRQLKLNVPVTGDFKIGTSWDQTH
jgi:DNA polymerase-1